MVFSEFLNIKNLKSLLKINKKSKKCNFLEISLIQTFDSDNEFC